MKSILVCQMAIVKFETKSESSQHIWNIQDILATIVNNTFYSVFILWFYNLLQGQFHRWHDCGSEYSMGTKKNLLTKGRGQLSKVLTGKKWP